MVLSSSNIGTYIIGMVGWLAVIYSENRAIKNRGDNTELLVRSDVAGGIRHLRVRNEPLTCLHRDIDMAEVPPIKCKLTNQN